jgi:hypothetical protein
MRTSRRHERSVLKEKATANEGKGIYDRKRKSPVSEREVEVIDGDVEPWGSRWCRCIRTTLLKNKYNFGLPLAGSCAVENKIQSLANPTSPRNRCNNILYLTSKDLGLLSYVTSKMPKAMSPHNLVFSYKCEYISEYLKMDERIKLLLLFYFLHIFVRA